MLIKIFKTLTSLVLILVLGFLITKRDIFLDKKISIGTPREKILLPAESDTPREVLATSSLENKLPPPEEQVAPSSLPVTQVQIKMNPLEKVSVYEHLNEGGLDTDESYRPKLSPCSSALGYRIGIFDNRFGISKADFLEEIKQSGNLWSDSINKNLFYYNKDGPLVINLIYDERQATTEDVNYLALEIENSKNYAEDIKDLYEKEKITYLSDGEQLTKDSELFQLDYKNYVDKVAMYNAQGGAPAGEYNTMQSKLVSLKEQAALLDARKSSLLTNMESINKKVIKYNELVVYINDLIKKSNALGAKKFTEGKFSPGANTIDIYQYNNSIKLRRVIAHELGHALGISYHTKNIQSIMYSFNSATTTILSKEDKEALQAVCSSY